MVYVDEKTGLIGVRIYGGTTIRVSTPPKKGLWLPEAKRGIAQNQRDETSPLVESFVE